MIASVVVTLRAGSDNWQHFLHEVSACIEIECGEIHHAAQRIPITIDVANRQKLETTTEWLRTLDVVAMLDVVFVHFDCERVEQN